MSVRLLLILLAVTPLVGTAWFAVRELDRTSDANADAGFVAETVEDHVHLTELRSHVLDERNWAIVELGVSELGVPTDMVKAIAGIDIEQELATASANVDRLITQVPMPGLAEELDQVRRQSTTTDADLAYLTIEQRLAEASDDVLGQLLKRASELDGGSTLSNDLLVLGRVSDARQALASQLSSYFSAQFGDADAAVTEMQRLASQHALFEDTMASLSSSAILQLGQATTTALQAVVQSPDLAAFRATISAFVTSTISDGVGASELSRGAVFADIDRIVPVFQWGTTSSAAMLTLVDAAGRDVAAASADVTASTQGASNRATWMFVVLTLASLAFAFAASRFIIAPLQKLADRARRLRDGEQLDDAGVHGPREVRQVSLVIDEAAANLELAERQARALAEGELEHSALSESAPGQLGASLQSAVQTLAHSLDEREEFRARLAHEAAHDGLTALPNRTASLAQLQRGLARTRRNAATLAVMFVDLDGFKDINDTHGHQAGDHVLRLVARRLVTGVRDGDHVGRLGGDEFLVLAEPVAGVDEALKLAERLQAAVAEPIMADGRTFQLNASIGVALTDPQSDLTADELLRDADLAVYKAKALGRGRIELCDEDLRNEIRRRTEMEASLRAAIAADQLDLVYQPAFDSTGQMVCAEALIRWDPRDDASVPPPAFIEFAERSDLIIELDNLVIRRVAAQLAAWSDATPLAGVPVSINISGRHFASDRIVDDILEPLRQAGVDAARLIVELTESSLLDDLVSAAGKLAALREAGVGIAIDDFGTGYTSLAYLRALPVDIIKIDRSFILDDGAGALLKLIIDTGHLIGASITAEGIETEAQSALLRSLGCDAFQGFYFARPEAPDAFETLTALRTAPEA